MRIRLFIVALVTLVGAVYSGNAMAADKTVSGTITYLNRSALPPGAVLDVELVDVSRADVLSTRMSSRRYAIGRVPFPFELNYDASLIDERFTYATQARILLGEKVLYRTTTFFPVLTRNALEKVDVIVDLMRKPDGPNLEGSIWEASEITGRVLVSDKRPSISFLPDGMVLVEGGCNSFRGPVEISGALISFSGNMAGTLMACPPPLDKLERDFLAVLSQVAGWVQSGDQLSLTNSAGVTVVRLDRRN